MVPGCNNREEGSQGDAPRSLTTAADSGIALARTLEERNRMIQRAVLLAAGRLPGQNGKDVLRPLVLVDGVPLIHRTLRTLRDLGLTDLTVVVGYRGDEIRTSLAPLVDELRPATLRIIDN